MKTKKFKIRIRGADEPEGASILEALENAERGMFDDHELILTFPDLSWLGKVFSPERVRLIQVVRNEHPESIYQLAKKLDRQVANVQRDVRDLAEFGILTLRKTRKKGQKREVVQPSFDWDGFDIAV